jgi:Glycosyltransferase
MWAYPRALVDSSAWMWSRKRRLLGADWQPWIVTPSHWLARLVRQATGDRLPIRVIPNGVDTERFRPAPDRAQLRERLGFPPTARIILLVAAKLGAAEKGVLPLLESLAQASAPEWVVLTVGTPIRLPKSVACRLQVRQLGYLSSPEALAQAYNAADVFCIPSLEDTFPTTVLEAMACGLPVVGFRTGGIPEQLTEETGILVPRGDFRALCHALAQILQDEELQHRMRFHARQHAVQEFSLERFLQRYCSLYEEVLQALPTIAVQAPGAAG